jgi:hypothetical protein
MYENKLNVKDDHRAPRTLTILETTRDKEPVTRDEDTDKAQSAVKVPTDGRGRSKREQRSNGQGQQLDSKACIDSPLPLIAARRATRRWR